MNKRKISFFMFIFIILGFLLAVLTSGLNVSYAKSHSPRKLKTIWIKDYYVMSDTEPFIEAGTSYVPIRFIAEELGYDVNWISRNRSIIIMNNNTKLGLKPGSNEIIVDAKSNYLDTPPIIKDGRTFIPLRFIAELFGENVDYDRDYKIPTIGNNYKSDKAYKVKYYLKDKPVFVSDFKINISDLNIIDKNEKTISLKSENEIISYIKNNIFTTSKKPIVLDMNKKIDFPDSNLELLIRNTLNIKDKDIYPKDMERLTTLESLYPKDDNLNTYITNLSGLEYAKNLEKLYLWRDGVKDLTPLENLNKLKYLNLSSNRVSNLEPLKNLSNLETLILDRNRIIDARPLINLKSLKELNLSFNNDLKDLKSITSLKHLKPFEEQEQLWNKKVNW